MLSFVFILLGRSFLETLALYNCLSFPDIPAAGRLPQVGDARCTTRVLSFVFILLGRSFLETFALYNCLSFPDLAHGGARTGRGRTLRHSRAVFCFYLLCWSFLETFAFDYCLTFPDLLFHHCADLEREAEQGDEALCVLVVVKLACGERCNRLVVEAVL